MGTLSYPTAMSRRIECPKCGTMNRSGTVCECFGGSNQRLVRVIRDLLDHPFPHDLMKLRRRVASEYGGDDSAARAEMAEWCSQELCDRELDAYIEARKAGNAIIAEYDPNSVLNEQKSDNKETR
jgi:hypothetical protein